LFGIFWFCYAQFNNIYIYIYKERIAVINPGSAGISSPVSGEDKFKDV
jgi:predicted HTH transcriptional regulator